MLHSPEERATKAQLLVQFQTQQLTRLRCYVVLESKFKDYLAGVCVSDEFYRFCVQSTAEKYTTVTRNIDFIVDNLINLFGEETHFVRNARQVQSLEQLRWSKTLGMYIHRLRLNYEDPGTLMLEYFEDVDDECDDLAERVNALLEAIQTDIDSIVDGYNSS
ncbi:hypothetical protein H4R33_003643 [Dimargaris cristalligena]|uniref:Uncharacterized protein n=1 Tax=Dimargaris cristalligena TaxID=215637 RepID=A0A4Q0A2C2_9FUNG|nr:hypothetical protein H4R33_003643 [Dimargaris cristalligena]RKP39651.1 hypothetical protein BJ085DRAFT_38530 [Dimargaris cristalligena]|eukprot:RKP39651.1 hypothetical protein BJ085DRAFT_38530 [Dimargaris cristalligena]